jgi:pSer/pThr/pTyr-binding forkhead associated (FHA) protein
MPSVRVLFNDKEIQNTQLANDVYTIGRQEGCDIRIDNLGISRNHARLLKQGAIYCVEDLNSANGTFVNGDQIEGRHNLNDGDVVTIGKFEITYSAEGETQAEGEEGAQGEARQTASQLDLSSNLNTMAMDSDAIRKQIQGMRQRTDTSGPDTEIMKDKPDAAKSGQRESGVTTSQMELRAREAEIDMLRKDLRTTRMIIALVVVLIIAAAIGLALFLKNG